MPKLKSKINNDAILTLRGYFKAHENSEHSGEGDTLLLNNTTEEVLPLSPDDAKILYTLLECSSDESPTHKTAKQLTSFKKEGPTSRQRTRKAIEDTSITFPAVRTFQINSFAYRSPKSQMNGKPLAYSTFETAKATAKSKRWIKEKREKQPRLSMDLNSHSLHTLVGNDCDSRKSQESARVSPYKQVNTETQVLSSRFLALDAKESPSKHVKKISKDRIDLMQSRPFYEV